MSHTLHPHTCAICGGTMHLAHYQSQGMLEGYGQIEHPSRDDCVTVLKLNMAEIEAQRDRWKDLYTKIRAWGEHWCEIATMHRKIVERVTMLSAEYQGKLDGIETALNATAREVGARAEYRDAEEEK